MCSPSESPEFLSSPGAARPDRWSPGRIASAGLSASLLAASTLLATMIATAFVGSLALANPQAVQRILQQDPSINNLVDPPDLAPGEPGVLGAIVEAGHGARPMILVPGLGFGAGVFESFTAGLEDKYTSYTVTLPGFGGTAAPPVPPESVSFAEQTWTAGAADAVIRLVRDRDLRDAVLVGHWLGGTQVALRVAAALPDRVTAVILLAGSARFVASPPNPQMPDDAPLERRVAAVDDFLAPRWFKTVTRETWDDNNFLPGDYARNPVLGLRLWRQAARPSLHVWVRYLCEFYAQDSTLVLADLATPTLLLRPGLEGVYHDPGNNYLEAYSARSWGALLAGTDRVQVEVIPNARVVMWEDEPELVVRAIDRFLAVH